MSFASEMRDIASELLSEYGQSVIFTRESEGPFNSTTGGIIGETSSTFSAVGHPNPYTAFEINNTSILQGDVRFIMYSETAPLVGDECTIDGTKYRVLNLEKKNLQGTNIVYRVQLRA